ncbi:hypothetical protein ACNITE_28095, partial [Escherichia coli]
GRREKKNAFFVLKREGGVDEGKNIAVKIKPPFEKLGGGFFFVNPARLRGWGVVFFIKRRGGEGIAKIKLNLYWAFSVRPTHTIL